MRRKEAGWERKKGRAEAKMKKRATGTKASKTGNESKRVRGEWLKIW